MARAALDIWARETNCWLWVDGFDVVWFLCADWLSVYLLRAAADWILSLGFSYVIFSGERGTHSNGYYTKWELDFLTASIEFHFHRPRLIKFNLMVIIESKSSKLKMEVTETNHDKISNTQHVYSPKLACALFKSRRKKEGSRLQECMETRVIILSFYSSLKSRDKGNRIWVLSLIKNCSRRQFRDFISVFQFRFCLDVELAHKSVTHSCATEWATVEMTNDITWSRRRWRRIFCIAHNNGNARSTIYVEKNKGALHLRNSRRKMSFCHQVKECRIKKLHCSASAITQVRSIPSGQTEGLLCGRRRRNSGCFIQFAMACRVVGPLCADFTLLDERYGLETEIDLLLLLLVLFFWYRRWS